MRLRLFMLRQAKGLTLIELMISVAITFVVVAAIFAVYSSTWKSYRGGEAQTDVQQYVRVGMERVGSDLRQAARVFPLYDTGYGTGAVEVGGLLPTADMVAADRTRQLQWDSASLTLTYTADFIYMARPMLNAASGNIQDADNDRIPDGYEFVLYYLKKYPATDAVNYDSVNPDAYVLMRYRGSCTDANEDGVCDSSSYTEGGSNYWHSSSKSPTGSQGIQSGNAGPASAYIKHPTSSNPVFIFTATAFASPQLTGSSLVGAGMVSSPASPPAPGIYDITFSYNAGSANWTMTAVPVNGGSSVSLTPVANSTTYNDFPVTGATVTTGTLNESDPAVRLEIGYEIRRVAVDLTAEKRSTQMDPYRSVRLRSVIDIRND